MGWLGWTEEETLATDVNAIELAVIGRMNMLKMCYGITEKPKAVDTRGAVDARGDQITLTPQVFDAMFRPPRNRKIRRKG